jgi:Nucleotidyltransferase domain
MTADQYLYGILAREAVDTGPQSPARGVQSVIYPIIQGWAGNRLLSVHPSGSFMKGTANKSGTDIDLFISLSDETTETLKEIYTKLFNTMRDKGYAPKEQNVSINIRVNGYSVDLVPGKRQNSTSNDHSLYRRRASTWTKTNVITHINYVRNNLRVSESRIIKLWRDQKQPDFPSFYLELTVIDALFQNSTGTLAGNVWKVFEYLRDKFTSARVVDPANTNNIISDDLSVADKIKIKAAAERALKAATWGEIIV